MKVNRQIIIEELHLKHQGNKGWLVGASCPFCGRSDKFGIILNESGISSYNCFHGNCAESGTIVKFLKKINRLDLLEREEINLDSKLDDKILIAVEKDLDYTLPTKSKPLGFRLIEFDPYLDLRGFIPEQYKLFNTGIALIEPEIKNNYIVFLQVQDGEIKGYLARSKRTKDWHKQNEIRAKAGEEKMILRSKNSVNTDFEKILGGHDEIIPNITETVIIVEGLMDKANTDRQLDLYSTADMKCCYTYGNKVSDYQIKRLQDKKVKNIILLYDYNTIYQTQKYSIELNKYFNCKIGEITMKERDPGDMSFEEFVQVFNNLKDPIQYNNSRVQVRILR